MGQVLLSVSLLVGGAVLPASFAETAVAASNGTGRDHPVADLDEYGNPVGARYEGLVPPPNAARASVKPQAAVGPKQFTFTIDASWSADDGATVQGWTAPGSAELTALAQVAGPPGQSAAIKHCV